MRPLIPVLALALSVTAAPACAAADSGPRAAAPTASTAKESQRAALPALRVRRIVTGLDNPWDVKRLPSGTLLITERDRARLSAYADGRRSTVRFPRNRIWVSGETGLMSLAIDRNFAENRRFYTCSGWNKRGGGHDVRVTAWRLSRGADRARRVDTLVSDFPTTTGRHGGCRLLISRTGAMLVGTGDAAVGTNPRNRKSLGGKTLRLDPATGKPSRGNPFRDARNRKKRYVFTYGHRNVQGLAQRRDGTIWSVEHGSFRDDEVNLLRKRGDYGWHPVPGYNESVPMTDHSLPGRQVSARWRSGNPTVATSGAAWVYGRGWGRLRGTLAVAALKANRVIFMRFNRDGRLRWTVAPQRLRQLGRLRSVTRTPSGALLITTDNDGGEDAILRVSPRG